MKLIVFNNNQLKLHQVTSETFPNNNMSAIPPDPPTMASNSQAFECPQHKLAFTHVCECSDCLPLCVNCIPAGHHEGAGHNVVPLQVRLQQVQNITAAYREECINALAENEKAVHGMVSVFERNYRNTSF